MNGQRLATLGLLATALVGLWQSSQLSRWAIDGPGPGLWPSAVSFVFLVLAIIVLIFPGRVASTEDGDTDSLDAATRAATRRTFALYAASLVVLALGARYAGFVITSMLVSVIVIRFAERRSWTAALIYGAVCALIGVFGFGGLLRVDLPVTGIERTLLSLMR